MTTATNQQDFIHTTLNLVCNSIMQEDRLATELTMQAMIGEHLMHQRLGETDHAPPGRWQT